jgi:hypothetical protein
VKVPAAYQAVDQRITSLAELALIGTSNSGSLGVERCREIADVTTPWPRSALLNIVCHAHARSSFGMGVAESPRVSTRSLDLIRRTVVRTALVNERMLTPET